MQECINGEVSDQGMVTKLRIGQPDATKYPERIDAQRL